MQWDAHSCTTLHPDTDLSALIEHRNSGYDFISLNVGMDMIPLQQIMNIITAWRKQITNNDTFIMVDTIHDVVRAKKENKLAVSFDLEGGNCLECNPTNVQKFYDLGVRQMHLAYNLDNKLVGGCHDTNTGLTPLGKKVVEAVHDAGMFMDMSHTSYRGSMDIMDVSDKPAIFSHANPIGETRHPRAITKEQAQKCASTEGIIGVTGHTTFLEDRTGNPETLADHIETIITWTSVDHVGLGWDYVYEQAGLKEIPDDVDTSLYWPKEWGYGLYSGDPLSFGGCGAIKNVHCSQTAKVMDILLGRGYSQADLDKIRGGNFYNLAKKLWK